MWHMMKNNATWKSEMAQNVSITQRLSQRFGCSALQHVVKWQRDDMWKENE